jgi:hypothetical protein
MWLNRGARRLCTKILFTRSFAAGYTSWRRKPSCAKNADKFPLQTGVPGAAHAVFLARALSYCSTNIAFTQLAFSYILTLVKSLGNERVGRGGGRVVAHWFPFKNIVGSRELGQSSGRLKTHTRCHGDGTCWNDSTDAGETTEMLCARRTYEREVFFGTLVPKHLRRSFGAVR